jgi:hypothetical protein
MGICSGEINETLIYHNCSHIAFGIHTRSDKKSDKKLCTMDLMPSRLNLLNVGSEPQLLQQYIVSKFTRTRLYTCVECTSAVPTCRLLSRDQVSGWQLK